MLFQLSNPVITFLSVGLMLDLLSYHVINQGEKELMELGLEKGHLEIAFKNEQNKAACLVEEKGYADLSEPFIIN